jgi:hypothetical protein
MTYKKYIRHKDCINDFCGIFALKFELNSMYDEKNSYCNNDYVYMRL